MEGKLKQKYIDKFGRNIIYKSIAGVYHFLLLRCSIWKYKWYSNFLRNQKKGTEKISIVFLASMPEFWNSLKTVYQAAMDHSNIEAHLYGNIKKIIYIIFILHIKKYLMNQQKYGLK